MYEGYWAIVNHKARKAIVFYASDKFVKENEKSLIALFNANLWKRDVDYSDTKIEYLGEDWYWFLIEHIGYRIITVF